MYNELNIYIICLMTFRLIVTSYMIVWESENASTCLIRDNPCETLISSPTACSGAAIEKIPEREN